MTTHINTSGSRKTAVARAVLSPGTGVVRINRKLVDHFPTLYQMRMQEPLMLAGDVAKKVNINVHIEGGGISGQADAARVAISRALVEHDASLEATFNGYDRLLLVADVRRKETHKPNCHGKARAKRQKSYR